MALRGFAILRRGHSRVRLEEADEVLGIFEAEPLAYQSDADRSVRKELSGRDENPVVDEVPRGAPGLCLDKFPEIFGRVAAFVRKVRDRRQAFAFGLLRKIGVQQGRELPDHAVVDFLAGDELPVVEAKAVVEEQLYVADYELARMFVYAPVKFLPDQAEHLAEYFYLGDGKVQGLVGSVVEEFVTDNVPAERGARKQVRMEDQGRPFRILHIRIGFHPDALPRGETGHRHLIEIVFGKAVGEFAALVFLEKEGIKSIVIDPFRQLVLAAVARHAYLRMKGLEAIEVVELLHRVEIQFFHDAKILTLIGLANTANPENVTGITAAEPALRRSGTAQIRF